MAMCVVISWFCREFLGTLLMPTKKFRLVLGGFLFHVFLKKNLDKADNGHDIKQKLRHTTFMSHCEGAAETYMKRFQILFKTLYA